MKCANRKCGEEIPLTFDEDGGEPLFALCDSCAAAAWLGFKAGGLLAAGLGALFGLGSWLVR